MNVVHSILPIQSLLRACVEGNLQKVVSLLEQGVNVDTTEGNVSYCEHVAIFGMCTILDCLVTGVHVWIRSSLSTYILNSRHIVY